MKKQEKIIIFSHENDIDGIGNIILGKIAFGEIDYVLASNVNILEKKFRERLEKGLLLNYDKIFITDLALYNPSLDMVSKNHELSKKVLIFDHHKTAIKEGCGKYSFTKIIESDENGRKRCGTDLFYEFLCSNGLLSKTKVLDEFVELTRLEDTWEWKNTGDQGLKAHDLAILLNELGINDYIKSIILKIKNKGNSFEFTETEKNIINEAKAEYLKALQRIWSEAEYFVDEDKNKFAGVYADYEYRNELAEYVKEISSNNLKYIIIIALEKGLFGQKSYRSIDDDFDVGKIAEAHGGNGHPKAASVNITREQKLNSLDLRKINQRDSIKYLVDSKYSE